MSNTVVYGFDNDGKYMEGYDIPRSMQGALRIWVFLKEKYGTSPSQEDYKNMVPENQFKKTWDLYSTDRLTREEKIVLGSTFDHVLIRRKNFKEVADALIKVEDEIDEFYNVTPNPHMRSNLQQQADVIMKFLEDPNVGYIGWNQMDGVCEDWSNNFGEAPSDPDWNSDGKWDVDEDYYPPYDISKGTTHWFLFEDMEGTEED